MCILFTTVVSLILLFALYHAYKERKAGNSSLLSAFLTACALITFLGFSFAAFGYNMSFQYIGCDCAVLRMGRTTPAEYAARCGNP